MRGRHHRPSLVLQSPPMSIHIKFQWMVMIANQHITFSFYFDCLFTGSRLSLSYSTLKSFPVRLPRGASPDVAFPTFSSSSPHPPLLSLSLKNQLLCLFLDVLRIVARSLIPPSAGCLGFIPRALHACKIERGDKKWPLIIV